MGRFALHSTLRTAALVLAHGTALAPCAARAESHGLILSIGDYGNPVVNLPGIDDDVRAARRIAIAMGIDASRITELKDHQLTLGGISAAMRSLAARIRRNDRVFIYYSGHGTQRLGRPGSTTACSEGIVAQDHQVYFDQTIVDDLAALSAKASQVVMMNDSCFSGGDATRRMDTLRDTGRPVPKFLPPAPTHQCGKATNAAGVDLTRNLEVVRARGARLLYLAASGENEAAYATEHGSVATQAWWACIASRDADTNHSGSISGDELRACAQRRIDGLRAEQQTITITGSASLPVTLGVAAATGASGEKVDALNALADLHAGAQASHEVSIRAKPELRIGRDLLEFSVRSNRPGYLYVLQVGSDRKTFNLLFPNRLDADNYISPGVHRLPRSHWRLRAGGPPGISHLLALVSPEPKDFSAQMQPDGPFAVAPAELDATRNLMLEAAGARPGGHGAYGASKVVAIREVR